MQSNERKPLIRKGKRGKVRMPKIHCGPGQNCKNSSASAANLISTILANGTNQPDVKILSECRDQSVCEDYLQP